MKPLPEKPSRNEALVKPELLVWARENAGLSVEEAAKKIGVKPDRLIETEEGKRRLTVNQLRSLSNAYKRPLAIFFLSKTPKNDEILRDFRHLPDEPEIEESPRLRYEIRRAKYRRKVALSMIEELGREVTPFLLTASESDEYRIVASKIRNFLGVSLKEQFRFSGGYEALRAWKTAFEEKDILVFQASRIELREMRGFSIFEKKLPVVVVNSKDAPYGRIFTMLHEFTHLMLRTVGLCNLRNSERTEIFCNMVAGEFLVPESQLLQEDVVAQNNGGEWGNSTIKTLANRYSVSREVIMRRLVIAGRMSESAYRIKRNELLKEYDTQAQAQGFSTPDTTAVANAGRLFTKLVLESYAQEKITTGDVTDYLEVRYKHLDSIEKAVSDYSF